MAIMYRLVTQPLQVLTNAHGSILELNPHLHKLQLKLAEWSDDGTLALTDQAVFDVPHPENEQFRLPFPER